MMVYGMGPKETEAAIRAIKSNSPDGGAVQRFADGFSVWSQSHERMVGNMKRRADGWMAFSYVTDRAEWFRYIAEAAKWVAEQWGWLIANVSERTADEFTWSIRECLPPPLDVDALTPRLLSGTFCGHLKWGIRDGAGLPYVGSIHHVGVYKFAAYVFIGDGGFTNDATTPAEAATWIVQQLENVKRWGPSDEV